MYCHTPVLHSVEGTLANVRHLGSNDHVQHYVADLLQHGSTQHVHIKTAYDPRAQNEIIKESRVWHDLGQRFPDHILTPLDTRLSYPDGTNLPCIVTPQLPRDLKDCYESRTYTPNDIAALLTHACEGIMKINDHGIVVRDIKPRNILVTDALEARLIDFGPSVQVGAKDVPHTSTDRYEPPEHERARLKKRNLVASPAEDVYSMAAVAKHLLCRDLTPDLQTMLRICMLENPQQRPAMQFLYETLNAYTAIQTKRIAA